MTTVARPVESATELAERYGLTRAGTRPPFFAYLRALWDRRDFIRALTLAKFHARNSDDRLGVLWNGIRPLIQALIYGTIFGILLPSSTRPPNYVAFVVIGVFVFHFMSNSMTAGTKSLVKSLSLIRSVHFPRAIIPIATVGVEAMSMVAVYLLMFIIVASTGVTPKWTWLWVFPIFGLCLIFTTGLALLCARITASIRDFAQLLPHLVRIMFYCSGILYEITRFHAHKHVFEVLKYTPFYNYITLTRHAVFGHGYSTELNWVLAAGWAAISLPVGLLIFWKAEETYGRD